MTSPQRSEMEPSSRFLPKLLLNQIHRSSSSSDSLNPDSSDSFFGTEMSFHDDILYVRPERRGIEDISALDLNSYVPDVPKKTRTSSSNTLAEALGIQGTSRAFQFSSLAKQNEAAQNRGTLTIAGPLLSEAQSQEVIRVLGHQPIVPPKQDNKHREILSATNILQAPGLRNDYYSNLVSWSSTTKMIAVGLGKRVYWWGIDNTVMVVPLENDSLITCVSVHCQGYLLVACDEGMIYLVDESNNTVVDRYENTAGCIYCFSWMEGTKTVFAGDESGYVLVLKVVEGKLKLFSTVKCVRQQVCGITLSHDGNQMAVGGNNNCCMVWDISDLKRPVRQFNLRHDAAVKALAFCPWTPSLLATGGGSRDRKIRFWHSTTGTLLSVHNTNAQVTSLSWSKYRREMVATYGFGGSEGSSLASVYSYPLMVPLREAPSCPNLRILSASLSPDGTAVCVAANDMTVRIYRVWNLGEELVGESRGTDFYGSRLIECQEEVVQRIDSIR